MSEILLTILTPTTGRLGLFKLIESIEKQKIPVVHILLWDDKRDGSFLYPDSKTLEVLNPINVTKFYYTSPGSIRYSIVIPGSTVQGNASGSSLRSIGLMAAQTPYICFADDDVTWEDGHLESLLDAVENKEWAYCRRKIWASESEYLGIDDFESVGNSPNRKVPYEMVDNNCMIFKRRLGSSGAVLYRETQDYNDDRLFYAFLKQYGGIPGKTNKATVNQICPQRLIPMFKENCTKS
jgi:glycosyltransferase involved in cell wall biosynthesis